MAAGLVFHEGRLLITQRPKTGHLANLWEFPGGKRERDESFEECLHRELKEELDIRVDHLELIESIEHNYPEKWVHLKFYRCCLAGGTPRAIGCQDLRWVAQTELDRFEFPPADVRLLAKLGPQGTYWPHK